MHPIHTLESHFPMIHFSIILLCTPRPSEWFLSFMVSNRNCVGIACLLDMRYMLGPSHSHWSDCPTNISWRSQFMELLIMQISPASCNSIPTMSKYSPNHSVCKHLSICDLIFTWETKLHSFRITARTTVLNSFNLSLYIAAAKHSTRNCSVITVPII
jgi:hypothetical protein